MKQFPFPYSAGHGRRAAHLVNVLCNPARSRYRASTHAELAQIWTEDREKKRVDLNFAKLRMSCHGSTGILEVTAKC